jgi:imidazolonepropionase-like amidohydrolase
MGAIVLSRRALLAGAVGTAGAGLALSAQAAGTKSAPPLLLEGGFIHLGGPAGAGKSLKSGSVLVSGGRITALGADVRPPKDAERIDCKGMAITAGFVDAYSGLGLVEVEGVAGTAEGSLTSVEDAPIHAAFRAKDVYNGASVLVPIAKTGGITGAVIVPRGGVVAGTSAYARLDGAAELIAPVGMHAVLGEASMTRAGGSRGRALEVLREALDDAASYAKRKDAFERNQTRPWSVSRLDLEALVPVLQGRIPLVAEVHRASDIRAVVELAKERKLRLVLAGATEAWAARELLAKAGVGVIQVPFENLPGSFDRLQVREDAPRLLMDAGVNVAFSTGSLTEPWAARTLRQAAGIAVSRGVEWDRALDAVTLAPRRMYGLGGSTGLAVGSPADLAVWSGDPFEMLSSCMHLIVDGKRQSLRTRQTLLFERYRGMGR